MTPSLPVECFGRESVCQQLIRAEHEDGAAFLFGGPLAGKSTVLRRVHDALAAISGSKDKLQEPVIPVLVELRELGDDFTPSGFYELLAAKASAALSGLLVSQGAPDKVVSAIGGVEGFVGALAGLLESCGDCQPKLYFLLDDCKRLTGFPRGFQDNLVHLLWGIRHAVSGKVAMAFSGAQELHSFFLDPTTPLRTRSTMVYLENLTKPALAEMASALRLREREGLVHEVLRVCGGHAGLSWLLLKRLASQEPGAKHRIEDAVAEFCSAKQELMRRWHDGLTPEAKSLAAVLAAGSPATRSSAAGSLRASGYDPALNIRALNEFVFVGVAVRDGERFVKAGRIFWDYFTTVERRSATPPGGAFASGRRFVFKRADGLWWFRFDSEDYGRAHRQLDGFLYIGYLLGRRTEPTHCVELRLKCKQPTDETARLQLEQLLHDVSQGYGPKQKYAKKSTKIEWQSAIEQLEGLIAEAKEAGDGEKADRLEEQKERLEKKRGKQIGLGGRLRPETSPEVLEDKTRKAVGKAMSEAIEYLKVHCPKLGEHLGDGTNGIERFSAWPRYRGQHDWDTEEVATRKVANR